MKNFVSNGKAITLVAVSAAVAGEPVVIGSLFGVAVESAEIGEDVTVLTEGVFNMPAQASVSQGDAVEWLADVVDEVAAGTQIGVAVSDYVAGFCDVKIG